MPRPLVISDANILFDLEHGELLEPFFRLDFQIFVPDVIAKDELGEAAARMKALGLRVRVVEAEGVAYVGALASQPASRQVGRLDLFALALAKQEACPLLTGDRYLRELAEAEHCEVHGTLWVVEKLVEERRIGLPRAKRAYDAMKAGGRRLPWNEVAAQLERLTRKQR